MATGPYFGYRGQALTSFMLFAIVVPVYLWFGYNNGVAGGLLTEPNFVKIFPRLNTATTTGETKSHNATLQGTVVALYTLSCMFGAHSCIIIGDKLGRLRTVFVGAIGCMLGVIIQCTSFSLGQLIAGRIIAGLGFGMITATVPVWQAECSQAAHRGSFVVLEGVFISGGLAVSQWISFGLFFVDSPASWRFPLAFPVVFGLIVVSIVFQCPESPRWLVKKSKISEARAVLSALRDLDENSEEISREILDIERSLEETGKASLRGLLKNGPNRIFHRTMLAAAGQLFQQMGGVNVIGYYASTIFEQYLKLTPIIARILSASVFSWQACTSFIAFFLVDKVGRRKLMLTTAIGQGIVMVCLAATVSQAHIRGAAIAASFFIFMFSFFFPIGFLGVPFLYATEVAPLAYRVPINAISTGSAWCFNFLVAEVTPVAFVSIGFKYYIVYAVLNICMILPCVYFLYPETAHRSLEEMDLVFIKTTSIFDAVKVARELPSQPHPGLYDEEKAGSLPEHVNDAQEEIPEPTSESV
jgi:sugar porter (SP) family MFS transporter